MPFKNEHSARIKDPDDFKEKPDWSDEGKFRRTHGGDCILPGAGQITVPETIDLIWGQLKEQSGDQAAVQSLRFPISNWTEAEAKKWLEDNKVEFLEFEPAEPEGDDASKSDIHRARAVRSVAELAIQPWAMERSRLEAYFQSMTAMAYSAQAKPIIRLRNNFFSDEPLDYEHVGGIALIDISGMILKNETVLFYDEVDTEEIRDQIQRALADPAVDAIMLSIDSPGGMVAGTQEVGDAIRAAREVKPLHAAIRDNCHSGALWLASQASHITANRTAGVGSIGVFRVIDDWTKLFEELGIKRHVISTGPLKGAGVPGSAITEEQLAEWQEDVNKLGVEFINTVAAGRGMDPAKVAELATGASWIAEEAAQLGLIDKVCNFEEAMSDLKAVVALNRATGGQTMGDDAKVQDKQSAPDSPVAPPEPTVKAPVAGETIPAGAIPEPAAADPAAEDPRKPEAASDGEPAAPEVFFDPASEAAGQGDTMYTSAYFKALVDAVGPEAAALAVAEGKSLEEAKGERIVELSTANGALQAEVEKKDGQLRELGFYGEPDAASFNDTDKPAGADRHVQILGPRLAKFADGFKVKMGQDA